MTKTEKLFYTDSYATSFSAVVQSVEADGGAYLITLDKTLFYPEGGGQPSDTGTLSGVPVTNVAEKDSVILHTASAPLSVGAEVSGQIDWKRRFSLMQNHSGEHIVSGIIKKHFGLENVGFHMGSEWVSIDISGELTKEELSFVEQKANEAVFRDIPIKVLYPGESEAQKLCYRSKIQIASDLRLIYIDGVDTCACCGLHCSSTGEVGLIKIINSQKYKSGTRAFLLCGHDALDDYIRKNRMVYELSVLLSAKPYEVSSAAAVMHAENDALKQTVSALKKQIIGYKVRDIEPGTKTAVFFEEGLTPDDIKTLGLAGLERAEACYVFSKADGGFRYAITSNRADARELSQKLTAAFGGKGGGRAEIAQGTVSGDRSSIEKHLLQAENRE